MQFAYPDTELSCILLLLLKVSLTGIKISRYFLANALGFF